MKNIALNLYSVRKYCLSPADLDGTLGKIRSIGYSAVQVSGVPNVPASEIANLLDKHDLACAGCHENLAQLRTDFPAIVSKLKTLGTTFTALGSPGDWSEISEEKLGSFISELEEYAQRFNAEGIRFGYHNHAYEMERRNGKTVLARIYDEAPTLSGEPDTYWIQRGGGDPATWIRRLSGRLPAVHLKDFNWYDKDSYFAEVGQGNLDWEAILDACAAAGTEWYIVEQDEPSPFRDIFESLRLSYEFLRRRIGE